MNKESAKVTDQEGLLPPVLAALVGGYGSPYHCEKCQSTTGKVPCVNCSKEIAGCKCTERDPRPPERAFILGTCGGNSPLRELFLCKHANLSMPFTLDVARDLLTQERNHLNNCHRCFIALTVNGKTNGFCADCSGWYGRHKAILEVDPASEIAARIAQLTERLRVAEQKLDQLAAALVPAAGARRSR